MAALSLAQSCSILTQYDAESAAAQQYILTQKKIVQGQKKSLDDLIIAGESTDSIQQQNIIINITSDNVSNKQVYLKFVTTSKINAETVVNNNAGVTGYASLSDINPFGGATGPQGVQGIQGPTGGNSSILGPTGIVGVQGVMGPTGPVGVGLLASADLDTVPTLGSTNLVSSDGISKAITSINSISMPTVTTVPMCGLTTVIFLPFDGIDGDTATVDQGYYGANTTFTFPSGYGIKLSSTQKKFGTTSLYFPSANVPVSVNNSTFPTINYGDFFFECWIFVTGWGGNIIEYGSWGGGFRISVPSTGVVSVYVNGVEAHTANVVSLSTWTHILVYRFQNIFYVFTGGTYRVQGNISAAMDVPPITSVQIGANFVGYIDQMNMVLNINPYSTGTNTFTPGTTPIVPAYVRPVYNNPTTGQVVTDNIKLFVYTGLGVWKKTAALA